MTRNAAWKKTVRKYAAEHGLTYQQAHQALTQSQAAAGQGWTADPAKWTHAGAGRWLVEFTDHGIGGDEIEPFHLDAGSAEDLKEQLGMVALRRGWIDYWVELNGLAGRLRFDGLEPGTDVFAEFTLRLDPTDDELVEMPWSVHKTANELLLTIQGRLDCTVDSVATIRGASGDDLHHIALCYWPGEQEFQIVHIPRDRAPGGGAEFTISDEVWPLAREDEAWEAYLAFQAKVSKDIRG